MDIKCTYGFPRLGDICETINIWNTAVWKCAYYLPRQGDICAKVNIWHIDIKVCILFSPTRGYIRNYKDLKYCCIIVHIFSIPHRNICKTVNIWNICMYKTQHIINPFMGHLPNSKHLKYGYKKAHIFTPTLGYLLLCETANIWTIFI